MSQPPSVPNTSIVSPAAATAAVASESEGYWKKAFDALDADQKRVLSSTRTRRLDIVAAVLQAAEDRRKVCGQKRWKVPLPGGRVVVLRDMLEKIAGWIDRFKVVVDVAVSCDPVHAALPWAAIRFLLMVAVGDSETYGSVVLGLETITRLLCRFGAFEQLYPESKLASFDVLRGPLTRLYSEMLLWLGGAVRYLSRPTPGAFRRYGANMCLRHNTFTDIGWDIVRTLKSAISATPVTDLSSITTWENEVVRLSTLMDAHISEKSRSKMAESMNELHGKMTRVFDVSAMMQKHLDKEDRMRFSEWLSTSRIREHHDLARQSLLPGSGIWLKQHHEYQRWLGSSSSAILMIHGVRGCGKSSLFSQIVDSLSSSSAASPSSSSTAPHNRLSTAPCAYFYCADSASELDRSNPTAILRCILKQLGEYPDPHTVYSDVWSAYDRRLSGAGGAACPTRLNMDDCV